MLSVVFTNDSILLLPEPTGPYGVGTVNIELNDTSRTQLRDTNERRWMATAFYPTRKTNATSSYMFGTLIDGTICGVKVLGHSIPDDTVIQDHKLPIILAFPGRGGERQGETILYEALASHGYIVITMDQPYVANFVKFPAGEKITLTFKDLWYLRRDRDYRYRYDDEVIASAIKDIDFTLKNLHLFGRLSDSFDTEKIILLAHSIGGNIAHIKGFKDKRIKAIVDIDSKITERRVFGHIGVPPNPEEKPVLFIRGMMQYQEDVGDQLTIIPNSTVWSPLVQHSAFSDRAYISKKTPNYGMGFWQAFYNWFAQQGPYFSDIDTDLGNYSVDEWFKIYPEHIIKWLDKVIYQKQQ
jgi:hypothetical protein